MRRNPRSRRGAAAIEFAMVVPILAAALLGAAEYGLMFGQREAVVEAAREAAWVVAVDGGSLADAQDRALALLDERGVDCLDRECVVNVRSLGGSPELIEGEVDIRYVPALGFVPTPDWLSSTHVVAARE